MTRVEIKRLCVGGSTIVLGLLLSGCGGGGGVASTPAPTYTKLANLSGDQTFQSAGIHFTFVNGAQRGYSSQKFGSGVVIAYNAANNSYTLTAPDGTTDTFSSATGTPPPSVNSQPNSGLHYYGNRGSLSLTVPSVNGVALSYIAVSDWNEIQNGVQSHYFGISGVPTIASDMPKNGTATYKTSVVGNVLSGLTPRFLQSSSTASFSANFGSGTVSTTLNLVGGGVNQVPVDFGSYSGSGNITSGGPGFSGTLASVTGNPISVTGEFSGAFFGPQATEMGYAWYLTGGLAAQGITTGTK